MYALFFLIFLIPITIGGFRGEIRSGIVGSASTLAASLLVYALMSWIDTYYGGEGGMIITPQVTSLVFALVFASGFTVWIFAKPYRAILDVVPEVEDVVPEVEKPVTSVAVRMEELKRILDSGIITEAEFEEKKKNLLYEL
ncbi:MAG: SHOCT domain-containing protein [Pseudomonadota bacterium]|nr:SHOCT domain-containing protein [Pseudomonadota bacterium]